MLIEPDNDKANNGCAIAEFIGPDAKANANHIEALWNAADGMTTEQAVAYLEHGAEMERFLTIALVVCNTKELQQYLPGNFEDMTKELLTKLEADHE